MVGKLIGRTALVTGGGKRLGRAIALALAGAGANVVVHYNRSEEEARGVAREIEGLGARSWAVGADLADPARAEGLIGKAGQAAGGRLDILVCSASIFPQGTFESITLDDIRENVAINAWAPFVLGRSFAAQTGSGHIVNLLDTRIAGYDWQHVAYQASKVLLGLLTRMMAVRFAPGIAVNAVAPGLILPPPGKDESYLESLRDTVPLRRTGSPEDITEAVLLLAGSSFITGQIIFVDGGRHLKEESLG